MVNAESLAQWGSFFSGVAAIALLLFVWYQISQMSQTVNIARKSFELTKEEISKRLRPWVGREDIVFDGVTLKNGIRINLDEFLALQKTEPNKINNIGVKDFHYRVFVKNYGQLPAQNLMLRSVLKENLLPVAKDLPDTSLAERSVLMPDESVSQIISVEAGTFRKTIDGGTSLYLLFCVDYEYEGTKGYYEVVGQFVGDRIDVINAIAA